MLFPTQLANKVVLVYPADHDGGVFNYRLNLPYHSLARLFGCKLKFSYNLDQNDLDMADIVVFNRQYNEGCVQALDYLTKRRRVVVFDLDDNVFEVDQSNPSYKTYSNPTLLSNLKTFIDKCTVFTVSTDRLAEKMKEYRGDKPMTVVENAIPWTYLFDKINNNHIPVISWHGGPSHIPDLDLIKELPLHTTYKYVSFGSVRMDYWGYVPTVPFRNFYSVLHTIDPDVALMPIKPLPFNYCRSTVKFLENTAVGASCVASNFGPYTELNDYVVYPQDDTVKAWINAIHEALSLRQQLVNKSRKLIKERYNLRKTTFQLGEAIDYALRNL